MEKKRKVGAPIGNKNAEKWTEEEAVKFMAKALKLSEDEDYDFIGEIAKDLGTFKTIFEHLYSRFPFLKETFKQMKTNLETNCYRNVKREKINTAAGIINLKSNHGWTDRLKTENTNTNTEILSLDPLDDASNDNS